MRTFPIKEKRKHIPWLQIHRWAGTNEWSAKRLREQPSSFCCMNESNFWFSAPPWTEQTHPSVDDITFLDFLPCCVLKATFVDCTRYETTDIWIRVVNNTNPAKTWMCHCMCIKQSSVCTTAARIVSEHAHAHKSDPDFEGWWVHLFFTGVRHKQELNKSAFWRTWIF